MPLIDHLPIFSIAIPMFVGVLMVFLKDKRRKLNKSIGLLSTVAQLTIAVILMLGVSGKLEGIEWTNNINVYLLGNWDAPYGILLVVDRLSALMLALVAGLGMMCIIYSTSLWDRAGVHYHPLFQFIMMGLNGAFLTGDLFNLFVFFEILLAASYGLLLHGSGAKRVSSGFHYIVVNMLGSFLMLIGISMIYSVTGTLNLADLGMKAGMLSENERILFEAACAFLATAYLIKAAAWPLSFWLINAYASSVAPVAAMFSIMTKVGIYALLRVGSLLLPTGAPAGFGGEWMYLIGLGTLFYGAMGLLAEKNIARMVSYCIVISSGTLLTALGMPGVALTGPSLYYMVSSVLALSVAFLLVEIIRRTEATQHSVLSITQEAFGLEQEKGSSDYSGEVVGVPIPASMAFLGLAFFTCTLIVAGLPPFSGFLAKFALLSQAIKLTQTEIGEVSYNAWILVGFMLVSGMITVIVLGRTGIRVFWGSGTLNTPKLTTREAFPIAILLCACLYITIFVSDVMAYMNYTAESLDNPAQYIGAVFEKRSVTNPLIGDH
ncbi:monovalent cation/H+ antiporter subunit D [Pelistega sp. NLN82]|uniref:Monovalent cation/H+ antiporter subunit D n=1 Tax=Pelistega ratti TaxID=2652177 RepID=A0A6L9Y5N6_9BURK|nr:monovalent cation/H+ antiporter subunit D [Pelistega ratti]NEN75124.1 monovalent cation/H+ antiporter subunit D [Pelistega ratti]